MIDMTAANYDQNKFIDTAIQTLSLKNDAALARSLDMAPPVISKIRHRKLPIGPTMLIAIHKLTDLRIVDIEAWADAVTAEA